MDVVRAATWRDESRLAQAITWTAASIALVVALAAPLGYVWLAVGGEAKEAAIAARLHAAFATQVVSSSADWRRDVRGLIDNDVAPAALPEARSILDLAGREIARSAAAVPWPAIEREAPLIGPDGGAVGSVRVSRSVRPLLWSMLLVGALSSALGIAIFVTLRVLPLRSLQRTLAALAFEQGRARREAEQRLQIVFDNSVEGILTLSPGGDLLTCNDAAATLFGESPSSLVGRRLTDLVTRPDADDRTPWPAVGHFEAIGRRRGGVTFPVEMTVSETRLTGQLQLVAIVRDVTERQQTQERLAQLANFDALTGLPNRRLFRERLETAMQRAHASGTQMALMFLDLDRFKDINDSLGHHVGDRLLLHVGQTLSSSVRRGAAAGTPGEQVTVSRLGGDEFTLIVEGLVGAEEAAAVARRILDRLHQPFHCEGAEIFASASIGITLYPRDATDPEALIRHADLAMYRSKELGRNTFHFFTEELNEELSERLSLEMNLRHALERNEFTLAFQPKASLRSGRITGVEALLRWNRPDGPAIGPDRFVPVLEETGLILPVGQWVLMQGCRQLAQWDRQGLPPLKMAVNLSARQFAQKDLPQQVEQALREAGIPPQRLELELTESLLMNDEAATLAMLAALRTMGVSIAIDDFGTGHSSLAYLKRFDVETLKIDRTFVRDTPDDPEDNAITAAVIALGHSLGLNVVAEGVENLAQSEFLRDLGCDEIQGYLLGRPMSSTQLPAWLANYREHVATRVGSGFGEHDVLAPAGNVTPLRRVENSAT